MEYWYIYKTTNILNGKSYIGMHKVNKQKIDEHYFGSGKYLNNAIKKYGLENFVCEIIEFNNSDLENREREKYWIEKLETLYPNGYNLSPGGEGRGYWDKETNKFVSINTWKSYTPEEREERITKIKEGLNKPEVRKVISEKSKEWHKNMSDEERQKLSKSISDGWTDEARESHRKSMSEYNKSISMSEKLKKKYGEVEGQKRFEEWKNSSKTSEVLQKAASSRSSTMQKQKTSPFWNEYQHQKAVVQGIKVRHKRGKISDEEFVNILKIEEEKMNFLHNKVLETMND